MLSLLLAACLRAPPVDESAATCHGVPTGPAVDAPTSCGPLRVEERSADTLRLRFGPPVEAAVTGAIAAPTTPATWSSDGDTHIACSPAWGLRMDASCQVTVWDAAGETVADLDAADAAAGTVHLALRPDDRLLGHGERTGGLDHRGRMLTFWNTDAYVPAFGGWDPQGDPLYLSLPVHYTLGTDGDATGLFLDSTWRSELDLGATDPRRLSWTTAGPALDLYLLRGPTLPAAVDQYTRLTGRPLAPPWWALGVHQSRWGWPDSDAVRAIVDSYREHDLPLDVVWLDIQSMDDFRSFTWDRATFGDVAQLVEELHQDGQRAIHIVDPALKVDPDWSVYRDAVDGDLLLMDGPAPYVGEVWPGDSVFPDFFNPETRSWWTALAANHVAAAGLDGLWIDMNEPSDFSGPGGTVPGHVTGADGRTMDELHNAYGLLEAQATRAALADDQLLLTRAGYSGIQALAGSWTGDVPSSWEALRQTPAMMMSLGLSGLPFVGSDVGGYSGGADAELFARWMQVGLISPFFRLHLVQGAADQYPWSFGTEVRDISRELLRRREAWLPYLYSLAMESAATGEPWLRPLVWDWPSEAAALRDDEGMLGPFVLFAPVLEPGLTARELWFPPGRWVEIDSGAVYEGPGTATVNLTLAALPLFLRQGALLPTAPPADRAEHVGREELLLDVVPGPASSFPLWERPGLLPEGSRRRVLHAEPSAGTLRVWSEADTPQVTGRTLRVRVRPVDHEPTAVRLDGREFGPMTVGEGWSYDDNTRTLEVVFADDTSFSLELTFDPTLQHRPTVDLPLDVTPPPDTPRDGPLYVASDVDGWVHHPLTWREDGHAVGLLTAPRGAWFHYKYTRGDWDTVEKWPGCQEASDRYAFGEGAVGKRDTVWAWRDQCPE